jgi:acyl-CoA dehydrogenase
MEDLPVHRDQNPSKKTKAGKKKQTIWRCRICGHVHYGKTPPEECPYCFFPGKAFKRI